MSADDTISIALKAAEVRLVLEARAKIERETAADMAELHRLAAKYNLKVVSADTPEEVSAPTSDSDSKADSPTDTLNADSVPVAAVETIAELAEHYRKDERSPYREQRFDTRNHTDNFIDRIVRDIGDKRIADLNAEIIQKVYDVWSEGGEKLATGHALVTKLRGLFSFGTTKLDDPGCQRLSIILNKMRFPTAPTRTHRLTEEHVNAIRAKAHDRERPSIALAQAIQFEFGLGQKDTIGEYVPVTEPGTSDIILDGMKWLYGIRWEQVDDQLVLRHVTSFGAKSLELDFKQAPMVLEELDKQFGKSIPKNGPIIVSEWNQKPWGSSEFRRWWRKIADAAGVPKHMKNMDSGRAADRARFAAKTASYDELDLNDDPEARLH